MKLVIVKKPKTVWATAPEKKKPGPKPRLGGERMNFVPGNKLRKDMDNLIEDAKGIGEKLTYAYILREGAIYEVRFLKDLLRKAKSGRLHAKRREGPLFPEDRLLAA